MDTEEIKTKDEWMQIVARLERKVVQLEAEVERLTPKRCPDCKYKSLVPDLTVDDDTTPAHTHICYNCGYERTLDDEPEE